MDARRPFSFRPPEFAAPFWAAATLVLIERLIMKFISLLSGAALACLSLSVASAHEDGSEGPHASGHAPIGVMGDHRHKAGEWMISYRYMHMDMDGNRDGTDALSPTEIATTVANPFSGLAGQPPTLRVIPTKMPMNMHMAGGMYGLSDRVTLMAMGSYVTKDMNHLTFMGGAGDTIRGEFTTKTAGFGDSSFGAIIGLDDGSKAGRQINVNLILSVPTGSNTETDDILTPMGGSPTVRLPYPMQLGTGTWDAKPAATYFDKAGKIGWGAQVSARIPLGKNAEDYRFGNRAEGTAWVSYEPNYAVSFSGRLKASTQGKIQGQDGAIIAPVQTADIANHGGEEIWALAGINIALQSGALKGHRFALEYGAPLLRDINGPQLETDRVFTAGWQLAF